MCTALANGIMLMAIGIMLMANGIMLMANGIMLSYRSCAPGKVALKFKHL